MYPSIQIITTYEIIVLYWNPYDAYIGISSHDSECGEGRNLFCIAFAIEYILGGVGEDNFCNCYLAIGSTSMLRL